MVQAGIRQTREGFGNWKGYFVVRTDEGIGFRMGCRKGYEGRGKLGPTWEGFESEVKGFEFRRSSEKKMMR